MKHNLKKKRIKKMYPGMILSEAMYVREIEEPPTKFTLLTYNI